VNQVDHVADLDRLDFAKGGGLVTVVAQDARSGAVLMVAHADREALERTLATREMHYRSRSRGLWRKGDTSGNVQQVVALFHDCDGDAVLAIVHPAGPACHTGTTSCFGNEAAASPTLDVSDALDQLDATIQERARTSDPSTSYTRRLLGDRNLRLKKLGEETAELVVACADGDRERAVSESADLFYHVMVALRSLDAGLPDLRAILAERARSS
jgi:phosphoribosyl-ATP pyrophosphohydrolase/phosphoribosyl-AMP cyclohydrolase